MNFLYDELDEYRQISNIRRTLVGNELGDHSDVVGASLVRASPGTSYIRDFTVHYSAVPL